jgi:ABC-type multidrug transport system fused ATPase/permease subunit
VLFARSIEENLRVGRPDSLEADLCLASERAQANESVARLTNVLSTIVGERDRSLSGASVSVSRLPARSRKIFRL